MIPQVQVRISPWNSPRAVHGLAMVLWCFPDFNALNLHKTHPHTPPHHTATNIFFCRLWFFEETVNIPDISAGKRYGRWTKDSQNTFYQFSYFPRNKEPLKQNLNSNLKSSRFPTLNASPRHHIFWRIWVLQLHQQSAIGGPHHLEPQKPSTWVRQRGRMHCQDVLRQTCEWDCQILFFFHFLLVDLP